MISANGGLLAHRYTPQVTPRWPRGSEPASAATVGMLLLLVRVFKQERAKPSKEFRETKQEF